MSAENKRKATVRRDSEESKDHFALLQLLVISVPARDSPNPEEKRQRNHCDTVLKMAD